MCPQVKQQTLRQPKHMKIKENKRRSWQWPTNALFGFLFVVANIFWCFYVCCCSTSFYFHSRSTFWFGCSICGYNFRFLWSLMMRNNIYALVLQNWNKAQSCYFKSADILCRSFEPKTQKNWNPKMFWHKLYAKTTKK